MAAAIAGGILDRLFDGFARRAGTFLNPSQQFLLFTFDVLKIVDFGLAAVSSHAGSRLTQTGTLIGTPYYMSPEQGQGLALDHRTDIYSLGVIMYEMFTGSLPYVANNPLTVLYMHARGEKDPPSARNPEILQSLEAVVLKAMAVQPENRYQSADELLGALTEVNVPAPA